MKRRPKKLIETYKHDDKKRKNNPPVGLVKPETDKDLGKKQYKYDPHIDPALQWAGKAEHTSFAIDTVSLHVHENIDPKTIINSVKKRNGEQLRIFEWDDKERPLREAIEFYKHKNNWTNRLIAGDSLLVMNSLLEKESMGGKVQMVYMDPPYGIKYGSNFQPFTNKRDVKDGKDEDLTAEPETIKAFRDTWEIGIHSYLSFMRDRLLLAKELLTDSGSCFVQISDKNVHLVRNLMDEVFGVKNFVALITLKTRQASGEKLIHVSCDYVIWYAKKNDATKFHRLYMQDGVPEYFSEHDSSGHYYYRAAHSQDETKTSFTIKLDRKEFRCPAGKHWTYTEDGMKNLIKKGRLVLAGNTPRLKVYFEDFAVSSMNNIWNAQFGGGKKFVVQTSSEVIQRCILMTTNPGDLVLDPTCGSGTTAYVAEQWGRRWITCDTSRVATTLTKQRLMTANFDYYKLQYPDQGVGSGFDYKTVPHITLKSIANEGPPPEETLYDQPLIDKAKSRVTGPFTVEAVPAPMVESVDEAVLKKEPVGDESIARSGETRRQNNWVNELLKTGIRGKNKQYVYFTRVELGPYKYLSADAETKEDNPQRAVICFGPEHAPLEKRQVENAIKESERLKPSPKLIIFVAFQFDPEAAKDIDETKWPGVSLIKVQMNADLLTEDLKRKRTSSESFWLVGQPDVKVEKVEDDKWQVSIKGFDYYNTKTGEVESQGAESIAMWMLDSDYDGRSLTPSQVFFPMAGAKDGWARLAKNLKAEIDEELIEAYRGVMSIPFEAGENKRIAVKIIDNRGIESLKIIPLEK